MASSYTPETFLPLLSKLVLTPDLFTPTDVTRSFTHLADPLSTVTPAQCASFVTALRLTGKDAHAEVIAAAASVLRTFAVPVDVEVEGEDGEERAGQGLSCDIVGTGGDGKDTFNVSTSAAIVAAGAGCRVYKHGNRASTSTSGSADLLLSLSCPITTLPPSCISSLSRSSSFLFLFAPLYHPTLLRLSPIRKSLGFPTIFNTLGPLINPAKPKAMIVGVHSSGLGETFVNALRLMGVERAWVVCGREGLDEISPEGETDVWQLLSTEITHFTVSPASFGLPSHPLSTVTGGTSTANALLLHSLLAGELPFDHPVENFVVINAAALLFVAGRVADLKEGVEVARESIRGGGGREAIERFRRESTRAVEELEA